MAIDLAHTLETPTPAPTKMVQFAYASNNPSDTMPTGHTDSSTTKSDNASPLQLSATAATSIPLVGARVAARIEPDPEILAQLRLATSDERELQIISTTIELQVAAPAWSLQHGIIRYNERYYIPVTSPLL